MTGGTPVVVSALFVAGGPEPQEGGGLGHAQTVGLMV